MLRRPVFDLVPKSHLIKCLGLVLMFVLAGIGFSVCGTCAVGCGGDCDSKVGCE